MTEGTSTLSAAERAILDEELALLERVLVSLAAERERERKNPAPNRQANLEILRTLQSEAVSAAEDDLPSLLHEMSVRKQLLDRPPAEPPPASENPYIAHLRVREAGQVKDYCLGQSTHLDTSAGVRVVDWRVAPVARIFYTYREGDEYEEEYPSRIVEGTVEARRVVVIERGQLQQIVAGDCVLRRARDGSWSSHAPGAYALETGGAGHAVRPDLARRASGPPLTALLDRAQFEAISAPPERPLLVLGSAGSGKTTVALHRLARIATLHPVAYPQSGLRVVVPEEGLARLSRRLLEPLGTAQTQVQTLDAWAVLRTNEAFAVKLPRLCPETPALVVALKRHPALYATLNARFSRPQTKAKPATFKRLRRVLGELFTDREFLREVVRNAGGGLPEGCIEETVRHTLSQLAEGIGKELRAITDRSRLRTLDGLGIAEGTPDDLAQTIDVEELPILLTLKAWEHTLDSAKISHLVLDEAEDFSLFDARVLGHDLREPKSVTLSGDEAQQTSSSFAGFDRTLIEIGASDAEVCRLEVSYRCPAPIFELAQRVLGPLASQTPQRAARDGAPVGQFGFPSAAQAALFTAGAVADLVAREPEASIAVVAHDAHTAQEFFKLLSHLPEARLVLEGRFSFEPGIDVTDLDSVKGLEFDYVIVPDATHAAYPPNDESRRRLHVAITRAVHQLWLLWGGPKSLLLD